MSKVTVVGAGAVGATCANVMACREVASEVVLIDIKEGLSEGKMLDMYQTSTLMDFDTNLLGVTNDYAKTAGSDVVVITSGMPRKPGMSREDLIGVNAGIVKDVVTNILKYSPDAILLIVSNPMDTMTTLAQKVSGLPTIADDSGLCVDALDGAPGVYSARYCGHHGDDEANNDKLLENMKDVPAGQRGAKFVAAVCFILPTGQHLTCRGECPGRVAFERLAGDYGFGYDPLFIPDECGVGKTDKRPNSEGRSYAQLTPDEKDAISHRGNALAEMEKELPEFLAEN